LIKAGTNLDAINEEGQSALTMAIGRQHMNVVKLLMDHGATTDRSGYLVAKPLHVAVGTRNMELIKCILDYGADIDEATASGTVLTVAIQAGHKDLVSLLLSRNADPDVTDSTSMHTSLFWAVLHRNSDIISMLLKHGA
ncbi:ankyrin, partial [Amniculicola lignicola CBS 123094]